MLANLFLGRDAFIDYSVSVTGIVLIIPALFWLYIRTYEYNGGKLSSRNERMQITTSVLIWLVLIPLTLLIAPGTSLIIQKLIGNYPYIYTMIVVPTALVSIYAFMSFVEYMHVHGKRFIVALLCLAILIITSSSIYMTYDHPLGFELISNPMKINVETQEICRIVGQNYTLLPEEIYGQIGEFDSKTTASSLAAVTHDNNYCKNVAEAAIDAHANCFVMKKSYDNSYVMSFYPFKKTAETKHYVIYQRSEE